MIAPRSTPSFFAIFSRSIFTHLPVGTTLSKRGERMYMTRPWLPSKIISMLGSAEPSCICTAGGIAKCMFIQPDLFLPSKMPFPSKENEPALPALTEARNSKRDDVVFAVVLAACATGSSARVSPPAQPTSAEVQTTRQRRARTRPGVIRD